MNIKDLAPLRTKYLDINQATEIAERLSVIFPDWTYKAKRVSEVSDIAFIHVTDQFGQLRGRL